MTLISVIIPVYNAARFLANTIESVQSQLFTDLEIIVVIDGKSSDTSEKIALSAAASDPRIRVLADGTRGVASNRNHGIERASAPCLAFLDSDDWWHSTKLERQLAFMWNHQVGLSTTGYYRTSEDGKSIRSQIHVRPVISYRDLLAENSIGCLTAVIDRRIFSNCRFPDQATAEDYALWLNLLRSGGTAHGLDEPLAYYREVKGSLSSKKMDVISCRWKTLRGQEKLSYPRSVYYLAYGLWNAVYRRKSVTS